MITSIKTSFWIIAVELKGILNKGFDRALSNLIWFGTTLLVNAYILPKMGIAQNYGVFQVGAFFAVIGILESYGLVTGMLADFEHTHITYYYAQLPLPTWMMFSARAIAFACICAIPAILIIMPAKLLLWNQLSLSAINWFHFILMIVLASFLYGFSTLLLASLTKNISSIHRVWTRIIFPLWFLGGFGFSWAILYSVNPWIAHANLANPIMIVSECFRSSMLGPKDFLPFWPCVAAIITITIAVGALGIKRLKKRLGLL